MISRKFCSVPLTVLEHRLQEFHLLQPPSTFKYDAKYVQIQYIIVF